MRSVVLGIIALALISAGCVVAPEIPGLPDNVSTQACYKPCHINLASEGTPSCIEASSPIACTLDYRLGDACLQYLNCKSVDGQCRADPDPRFQACVSCYRSCSDSMNGSIDAFQRCDPLCSPKF